jgi:putative ABC transport system substrate-binding protein
LEGKLANYRFLVEGAGKPMRRREFIAWLGATPTWFLATQGGAFSQQQGKTPRIGVLVSASPPHPFADLFKRGLQNLGYTEGRNIVLEFRYTDGRSERAAELAAELVRLNVDVIVAHFTPAVRAALGATGTIPIVMAPAGAPLQTGFIQSLARPGGNVTGLSAMDAEIGGRRVQLLRELIPGVRHIAVLATTTDTDPYSGPYVEDLRLASTRAGVRLHPVLISGPSEFESALATMAKAEAQAVIVQPFFDPHTSTLLALAAKHRLAYMSANRAAVVAGGLVSISANFPLLYERAAGHVDKIIKGANPATLPVEQPSKFQVIVNMKTVKALGLNVSPSLLAQIDEIIE